MSNDYRFNVFTEHARRILIVRVIGPMPSAHFSDRLFSAYDTIDEPWTWNRLIDFRRFEGVIDFEDVEAIAQKWSAMIEGKTFGSRVAFVSLDPLDKVRVPTTSPLFPKDTVVHFTDYHEAMGWLSAANGDAWLAARAG